MQLKCFDNSNTNKFTSRMFTDVGTISRIPQNLLEYTTQIISKLSFIGYTLVISWEIGLFMVGYVILTIILRFSKSNLGQRYTKVIRNITEEVENIQMENIRGMKDVRSLNTSDSLMDEMNESINYNVSLRNKFNINMRCLESLIVTIEAIINFLFIALCVYLISHNRIDIAIFIIVYNYRGSIERFAYNIAYFKDYLAQAAVSAQRINELFNASNFPVENFGNKTLNNINGNIEFKNVKFEYTKYIPARGDTLAHRNCPERRVRGGRR